MRIIRILINIIITIIVFVITAYIILKFMSNQLELHTTVIYYIYDCHKEYILTTLLVS